MSKIHQQREHFRVWQIDLMVWLSIHKRKFARNYNLIAYWAVTDFLNSNIWKINDFFF